MIKKIGNGVYNGTLEEVLKKVVDEYGKKINEVIGEVNSLKYMRDNLGEEEK